MLFLLASLALCAGVLLFAAFSHVPLIQEGGTHYFEILSNHHVFYDKGYLRLFDTLLQLPAVAYLRAVPGDHLGLPTLLLDLPYMLHPLAGVFASYFLLRKYERLDLFFLPVLALATSALPVLGFAVSTVGTALSLFWPLLIIACFERSYKTLTLLACATLSTGLALTHESSVFLFGAIGFAAVRSRSKPFFALIGLAIAFLVYRMTVPAPYSGHFAADLTRLPEPFRIFSMAALLGILASLTAALYDQKRMALWTNALLASSTAITAWYLYKTGFYSEINGGAARFARTTAALTCALTGVAFVLLEKKLRAIANSGTHVTAQLAASIVLIVASIHLLKLTFEWRRAFNFASIYASEMKGCFFLSETPHAKLNYYSGPGGLTGLTLVAQQTRFPRSIFFQRDPNCAQEPELNPCHNFRKGGFQRACGSPLQVEGSKFDFSFITLTLGQ